MQLSLFPNKKTHHADELLTEKANALLDALNEGRKEKERYHPQFYFQEKNMLILIASNKDKDILCNIIDLNGNTPDGFSSCWRNIAHIKHEINTF